jgi:hypothetical protein
MKFPTLLLLTGILFVSLMACSDDKRPSTANRIDTSQPDTTKKTDLGIYTDSAVTVFDDSAYRFALHIFDKNGYDREINNAIVTFSKKEGDQIKVIFRDSLYSMYPYIEFQDFNNDKIKDVLVFCYTGARANPTYHLYLSDIKNHQLRRVKEFEELPNPNLDSTNNIITSVALSGTNYYHFYRISNNDKLIDLGYNFEENPTDSTQYEHAIQQIVKKGLHAGVPVQAKH